MFLEQFPIQNRSNGWIEVICGSMFSGKTEELIRRLRRAEFAKQDLILFKPSVDVRYSNKNVVSHRGTEFNAMLVANSKEILGHVDKQKADAFLFAVFVAGTYQTEDPVSVMTQCCPGFGAVNNVVIAVAYGAGF